MLRNLFLRFGKRPSTDLDTERSVCGKASPSTTAPGASHDNEGRSVHQLWPLEDHVRSTNFDVVFFHGLHWPSEEEAWKSTWTQLDDPQDCWPQNWLPQELDENVRVLSISCDACPTQSEEKESIDDVSEMGKNILQTLVLSNEWRLGRQHGFVLVGHCFGGLVIKSLVEEARKRARLGNVRNAIDRKAKAAAEMFLKNLKGVVFYAVPHSGSKNLTSYFSRCNQITIPSVVKLAGFMQNVQPLQLKMENLSTTFDAIVEELSINVYAFVEGKPMKDVGFRLVEKAAALRSTGENHYTLEDCDHSTVCKPPGKNHPSYYRLLDFIRTCRQEEREAYFGFEYNWKENFQFYVEPSNLPNILLQKLKEEGSKNILVYGGFGYGKTTLVKYVLYKNAKELDIIFHGGIFHMKYGPNDNEVLSAQKELIRALQLNPLEGLECWPIVSVRAKLADLLNARSGPILLFIDDAWNGQMIDNSPEFKRTKGSKLLVTSRFNLKPNQPNWVRIEMNQRTNIDAAAQLLARKAANNPNETKFPLGCEKIAQKILFKCDGCLLAITIIGEILMENKAQTPEKWKDVYEKFEYYADNALAAEDYKGESKTIFAAIKLSLEYGQEESDLVGMENILQAISLSDRECPAIVVQLVWSYIQPQRGINQFKMLLNCLIARNLVDNSCKGYWSSEIFLQDSWAFEPLRLPNLVKEYVLRKLPAIDICNVLENGSQELFMEKFLLAAFLPLCRPRIRFSDPPCVTDGHLKQENQLSTIGIGDTSKNCFQTGLSEMENDSIFTMGRKGEFEGAHS
ncbi:hypothetical protein BDL97_05G140400 [Sphagnum fallax]|nr:hypothetical protein BDL97_05G140400 [Sphagnum fallax]